VAEIGEKTDKYRVVVRTIPMFIISRVLVGPHLFNMISMTQAGHAP
jgi:hypothetical protein